MPTKLRIVNHVESRPAFVFAADTELDRGVEPIEHCTLLYFVIKKLPRLVGNVSEALHI